MAKEIDFMVNLQTKEKTLLLIKKCDMILLATIRGDGMQRHKTDYWIKNDSVDVSIKDIVGPVTVHWHEFYEIELILSGDGIYHIDGIDYPIKRGALFVMSPSSFHRIHFTKDTRLVNFMFTLDACDSAFLCGIFDTVPHIMMQLAEKEIDFIHTLAEEMERVQSVKYLSAMMNSVLGKIQQLHARAATPLKNAEMQYAILYIQNHFKEDLRLSDVARIANYSPNYFGNKFKEYTGVTFKAYITSLQFTLAEQMLEHTPLSITEICYQCGFRDFSNFMTYFKKRHGITPGEYRKRKCQ